MSEQHCDDYISKLAAIKTACDDDTTTKNQIETLLTDLSTINDSFETDIESMSIPATMAHLNKFIVIQNFRATKNQLLDDLINLMDTKSDKIKDMITNNTGTEQDRINYTNDTNETILFIKTLVLSCPCMKSFIDIGNKRKKYF